MLNKKVALIAGITGQDGFYLSKLLIKKNYKIIGLSKRISSKTKKINIIKTNYSYSSLEKIIKTYKPSYIYNLAAISFPSESWIKPRKTFKSILDITLNFLEIIKDYNKNIRYFNASSSEIFKKSKKVLNENSSIFPVNPYGIAKSSAHFLVSSYRENYKMFAVNGILFNHDSPQREKKFLIKYLISESIKVKNKKKKEISLSDYRPIRDFGFAGDYMEAAYKILSYNKPNDFVIATGNSISVRDLTKKVISNMKISPSKVVYRMDNENSINPINKASIKKIKKVLSWKPKVSLEKLLTMMIKKEKNYK